MRKLLVALLVVSACGGQAGMDAEADALAARSPIQHLIVIVQENHSFDAYFGSWCTAPAGSNPSCTSGSACCEAAPARDPGTGDLPVPLTDISNAAYNPDHTQACENVEMDGGKMDMYVSASCGSPLNFSQASSAVAQYRSWAQQYALADRYFQPVSGASSSNDMYLATARFKFLDNTYEPQAIGSFCSLNRNTIQYTDTTIGDLLNARGVSWAWFAEGYAAMKSALLCPLPPADCTVPSPYIPCIYDPSDIPAAYFRNSVDNPADMRDLSGLASEIKKGTLPSVSFVKFLTYHNEHPGFGTTISSGVSQVTQLVNEIEKSKLASSTLVLLTWDESGGYFDHVAPPPPSQVDGQPYGARVPLLALGPLARKGFVSHAVMEHSSIVKFIEWNWLGATGQLGARDAVVNNIGTLVDPAAGVPEN